MAKNRDKGGGSGKYGRNKIKCQIYRNRRTREKNKAAKLARIKRGFRSG